MDEFYYELIHDQGEQLVLEKIWSRALGVML